MFHYAPHQPVRNANQLNEVMEIYVNEKKVVTLGNKDEFAAIDLLPSSYAFKCKGLSPGSGMATPVPIEMRVESVELVFLAGTFFDKTPGAAYLFGVVSALAGKNFVVCAWNGLGFDLKWDRPSGR